MCKSVYNAEMWLNVRLVMRLYSTLSIAYTNGSDNNFMLERNT